MNFDLLSLHINTYWIFSWKSSRNGFLLNIIYKSLRNVIYSLMVYFSEKNHIQIKTTFQLSISPEGDHLHAVMNLSLSCTVINCCNTRMLYVIYSICCRYPKEIFQIRLILLYTNYFIYWLKCILVFARIKELISSRKSNFFCG